MSNKSTSLKSTVLANALSLAFNNKRAVSLAALAIAAGMAATPSAYAQSAEGSIFGTAKAGSKITITSVETGSKLTATADANGNFSQAKLPPGNYRLTADGVTKEITVSIGSGTQVDMTAADVAKVVVSRTRSTIDVSSVEANTVFTAEQLRALPVARDVNAVAVLAPGVVKGDAELGNGGIPAFAGASVAENGYYINGFDVTNIRNFLSYANLPFDAIGSQQIKSGGYGAEYGRSLGGVISIVTKRGTNEWQFGGAFIWEPNALRSKKRDVLNQNYLANPVGGDAKYLVFDSADKRDQITYDVYAGGPIIKDKLFFFGLIEGERDRRDIFENDNSYRRTSTQPNGMVKVDFLPTDEHRFELTGITNKRKTKYIDYAPKDAAGNPINYSTSHIGAGERSEIDGGGHVVIGKYTGYLTDSLTISALTGRVKENVDRTTGARMSSIQCPIVYDENVNHMGCWKEPFADAHSAWKDPNAPRDSDKRKAWRFDVDYVWGDHTIRGGIDNQEFKSAEAGSTISGDAYYRYLITTNGTINGVANAAAPGTRFVRWRISRQTSGEFVVKNDAYYIEDSWKASKNLTLYGGLRWESFDNKNGAGQSFVKADNLLAPRLGFAWDVNGDASFKAFGNAGRYYIPVASNTNIRMTRGELFVQTFHTFNGMDPVTKAPLNLSPGIGNPAVVGDGTLPDPTTVSDINLKPMSQDEYILGFQKAIMQGWTFGLRGISRKVQNGMDDYCSHSGFDRWAKDNGHTKFDWHSMAQCILLNPGNDVTLNLDLNNDGKLTKVTVPASYIGLEKYTRTYRALEFTLDRPFDGKWGANISYVLSKSRGSAEGYVNSTINQEDAGVSQDFDFPSLTHGSNGYLANDRRHVIKAYGTYMIMDGLRLGFNASVSSGRPISCIGYVPITAADYADAAGYSTASSYYCLNDQGKAELHNRGTFGRTPWTHNLDLNLTWMPKVAMGKLSVSLDVFNIFNQRRTIEVSEQRDYSRATSNALTGNKLDLNWKQPTSFQDPRSVRITTRYEF